MILLEPIKPINIFAYRCDSHFLTDPLREMLASEDKYGFIVVDGNGALLALVQGNSQREIMRYHASLPKKHNKGGQSAPRFGRLRDEARHNYLTKVAEFAVKCFIDPETSLLNVVGIVLAGSAEIKDHLNDPKILDPRIQSKILGTVDISYGFKQGLSQAVELAAEILKGVSLITQKKLVQKFFSEISQDTGKFCFGITDTMTALEAGAIETLIIWDKCNLSRFKASNSVTGTEEILFGTDDKPPVKDDIEIIESELLLDWLVDHYKEFGTQLEIIQDSTPEGSQFCQGFGGFGGLLRYKMFEVSEADSGKDEEPDGEGSDSEDFSEYF